MGHILAEERWSELKELIQRVDQIRPSPDRLERVVESDGFDQMKNTLLAEIEDQEMLCE